MSHLILVGAGHVHLGLFARLSRITDLGHRVTVISRSESYCYSGMAPGVLGGQYSGSDITLNIQDIVQRTGVRFLPRSVVHINPSHRILTLDDASEESYDIVSFNIGSHIPIEGMDLDSDMVVPAKPILNFLSIRDRIENGFADGKRLRVVIAGGGPAGLEISANLAQLAKERGGELSISLVSTTPVMSILPWHAARCAAKALKQSGIRLMEGYRLESATNGVARISETTSKTHGPVEGEGRTEIGGSAQIEIPAHLVILATGVKPEQLFRESGLPVAADGALLVNAYLQCPEYPEIFGGGDCVSPLSGTFPRIGVVACRQNPIITRNLIAALSKRHLSEFRRRRHYLQIFKLTGQTALMAMGRLWFKGPLAFRIKDAIDRRFIRRLRRSLNSDSDR